MNENLKRTASDQLFTDNDGDIIIFYYFSFVGDVISATKPTRTYKSIYMIFFFLNCNNPNIFLFT
jgi:hypothetical protein